MSDRLKKMLRPKFDSLRSSRRVSLRQSIISEDPLISKTEKQPIEILSPTKVTIRELNTIRSTRRQVHEENTSTSIFHAPESNTSIFNIKLNMSENNEKSKPIRKRPESLLVNKVTYTVMEQPNKNEAKSPLHKKFRAETIKHFGLKEEDLIDRTRKNVTKADFVEKNICEVKNYKIAKELDYYRKMVNNQRQLENVQNKKMV